ncbi:hypothetical protein [Streptomyces sp. NPDC058773]
MPGRAEADELAELLGALSPQRGEDTVVEFRACELTDALNFGR